MSHSHKKQKFNESKDYENENNGRTGRINRIFLKNFMVHECLEIQLGLHCNIFIGANGSGKSAIASGIAVCLGSSGRRAGRKAARLSDYIRVPPDGYSSFSAQVSIRFDNTGRNAYKEREFGNSITIERLIALTGESKFRLSKHRVCNETRPAKKVEIDNYREHIGIDMADVTTFLSQDAAKQLLQSRSGFDFYQFFERSLNVDASNEKLDEESTELKEACRELSAAEEYQKEKAEELLHLRQVIDDITEKDQLIKEHNKLQCHYEWRKVQEREVKIQKLTERLKENETQQMTNRKKYNAIETSMSQTQREQEQENAVGILSEIDLQIESLKKSLRHDLLNHLREEEASLHRITLEKRSTEIRLQQTQNRLKDLEKDFDRDLETIKLKKDKLEKEDETLANEIKKIKLKLDSDEEKLYTLNIEVDQSQSEKDKASFVLGQEKARLEELLNEQQQQQQEQFETSSKNDIRKRRLGLDIERIQNVIQKNSSQFQHIPIGPVVDFIFPKPEFVNQLDVLAGVESHLEFSFSTYLIKNRSDQMTFERLLKAAGCQIPKLQISSGLSHSRYNRNQFNMSQEVLYIWDVLEITNPAIANYLVDLYSIESVGLFKNYADLHFYLQNRRLSSGIDLHSLQKGRRVGHGEEFFSYKGKGGVNFLVSNQSNEMKNQCENLLQKEIDSLDQKIKKYENYYTEMIQSFQMKSEKVHNLNQSLQTSKTSLHQKNLESRANLSRLIELNVEIERAEENNGNRDAEREKLEIILTSFVSVLKGIESKLEITNESIKTIKKLIYENKEQSQILENRKDLIQRNLDKFSDVADEFHAKLEDLDCQMKQINTDRLQLITEKEAHETELSTLIVKVKSYGSRPRRMLSLSMSQMEDHLKSIRMKLDLIGSDNNSDDIESLKSRSEICESALQLAKFRSQQARERVNQQEKNWTLRNKTLVSALHHHSAKMKDHFESTINKIIHFEAKIEFDHSNKLIEFYTHHSTKPIQLSTLSGGERASLQAGFLMALAKLSKSPIHILDEFDVYLDEVTRLNVMKLFIEFAFQNYDQQFVFITPHSEVRKCFIDAAKEFGKEDFVKIFNLS